MVLSDSLPMLEHMGVRVLGEHNHRIGAAAARARRPTTRSRCTTSSCRPACPRRSSPKRWRGCSRRPSPASSPAASRTTTSTAWCCAPASPPTRSWCCAPMPSTCGRSASRSRRPRSRPRWRRTRASRACWWACSSCASTRQRTTSSGPPRRSTASRRRSRRSATCTKTACCASCWRSIQATLRTNFWRTGIGHTGAPGPRRSFLSFKLDSARVPGLPEPRPLYEISVYSPRFEGIHLRGGKVARGGLRWSDRPEDFRTEVLGLVKAQMVKNTVIVPVGSKGGFVLKKAPPAADREAYMAEGVACYQDYLRALLDLTDNLVGGKPVPPPQVVRHRRRRPLPGGGRRQGHGDVLRLRQRDQRRVRPLAGRCLRLRRQRRLRPQGHGHHRARRVGERQAALPRVRRRHAEHAVHRRRHRRHVGRRVRQRHAAVAPDPAAGGLRPPPHLHRPEPRRRGLVCRARAAVQAAAFVVGGLRQPAHLRRRRHLGALREVDSGLAAGAGRAGHRGRPADAERADQRHPEGAGRPALQRRHRHLRQGQHRDPRRGRRPRQRRDAHQRPRAALQGGRRRRQPGLHPARAHRGARWPACASTPTRSTTRPASTPPTTRSTSRSCSAWPSATAR